MKERPWHLCDKKLTQLYFSGESNGYFKGFFFQFQKGDYVYFEQSSCCDIMVNRIKNERETDDYTEYSKDICFLIIPKKGKRFIKKINLLNAFFNNINNLYELEQEDRVIFKHVECKHFNAIECSAGNWWKRDNFRIMLLLKLIRIGWFYKKEETLMDSLIRFSKEGHKVKENRLVLNHLKNIYNIITKAKMIDTQDVNYFLNPSTIKQLTSKCLKLKLQLTAPFVSENTTIDGLEKV